MNARIMLFSFTLLISAIILPQGINFPLEVIASNNLFNNRQFAAFDQNGKIHVSYTGQSGTNSNSREIYYVYETAGGFSDTLNISSNTVDDNYSTLSIDNNNKVHIVFIGRDASSLFQLKYTNNVSGSFFTPVYLSTGGLNKATPYSKIGPDSVLHIVYFTFTNDPDNAYYLKHDLRTGQSSSPLLLAAAETSGDFDASLDVDSNGKVHILLKSGGVFGGPLRYYNDISGTVTQVNLPVTANVTTCKVAVDKTNKVHIVYRLESELRMYYTSGVNGVFSTPVVFTPPGQRPSGMQNIAVDDSQRVYVIYQSSSANSGKGFYLVYGQNGVFSDTTLVYEIPPQYVTRNSSAILAKGNGYIAAFFTPGGVRDGIVLADIFMKRGQLFEPVPVEFASFTYSIDENSLILSWVTASETNNNFFTVEKLTDGNWEELGVVKGQGTAISSNSYYFRVTNFSDGDRFRVKQTDFDGTYSYSNELSVNGGPSPDRFALLANYPNPFNPTTTIEYTLREPGYVTLSVYTVMGELAAVLTQKQHEAGNYRMEWNAESYPSGVYYAVMNFQTKGKNQSAQMYVQQMVLMK